MVSIKDIAIKCGVSIATVSKALNNHNDVSSYTKQLVCETAKQMGYLPNSQARALKTNKTYNIGVLFVDKANSGLTHNYFSHVLDGFKVEAEKKGYDITFISSQIGGRTMTYLEHCRYRNVDGIMVACVDFYANEVLELLESNIPLVTIDFITSKNNYVISDNYLGMEQIVDYIYSMGHKKIAYIYGEDSQVTSQRLDSFQNTMKKYNLEIIPDYIKQGRYHDIKMTETLTKQMLNIANPPTCIIMPDDFSALGGLNAIADKGLVVPNDISIVGYDGIMLTQLINPHITTIKQNTREIGKKAAELLTSLIKKEEVSNNNNEFVIKGEFIVGETVKNLTVIN